MRYTLKSYWPKYVLGGEICGDSKTVNMKCQKFDLIEISNGTPSFAERESIDPPPLDKSRVTFRRLDLSTGNPSGNPETACFSDIKFGSVD